MSAALTREGAVWRVRRAGALKGLCMVPGDKSVSHRAVMFGAMAKGTTRIDGWLAAGDCLSTLAIVRRLGVAIRFLNEEQTSLEVEGRGPGGLSAPVDEAPLDCGNSGTTMRLMAGVLAGQPFRSVLTGDDSLLSRPMARVTGPLRALGARIEGPEDAARAPLTITGGGLVAKSFDLPVASAQVKSCILLAGLHAQGTTRVREPFPSRDHTERMLRAFGALYRQDEDRWHAIDGGGALAAQRVTVPGDISSAAFFLVAAAVAPRAEVEFRRVGMNPGRSGIIEALTKMGAKLTVMNAREESGEPVADILVKGGAALKGIRVAGGLVPRLVDEVPALAVAACFAEGVTVIRDAGELRVKETDRIAALAAELGKLGAKVGVLPDGLAIEGGAALTGAAVESRGDHRMAMALAVAGLFAAGETVVHGTECVATSYPGFAAELVRLSGGEA